MKNEATPPVEGNIGTGWWEDEQISLRGHRTAALARCCEALALVVRDVAHVTPYNCRAAVRAVRIFARATLHDGKCLHQVQNCLEATGPRPSSYAAQASRGREPCEGGNYI